MGTAKDLTFDVLFPTEVCPVCGKEFMRRCKRHEWGYWANAPHGIALLCSSKCCKIFEERQFKESIKAVSTTKAYKVYKLMHRDGMYSAQAMREAGLASYSAVTAMELHKWKELEWLKAHNWEVSQ